MPSSSTTNRSALQRELSRRKGRARERALTLARRARAASPLPPRHFWRSAVPGMARVDEARWDRRIRRTPIVTAEEHCRRTGLKDIEEVVHCTLCGDDRVQPLFEPRDDEKGWRYHVVRCPTCSFLYRLPGIRPERLGALYAGRYDKFLTGHYGANRKRRYELVMEAFSPLFEDGGGRRLFDFGCGAGAYLEMAQERGFDVYGVDLSQASIDHARTRPWGRNAYYGSPMDVPEIAAGGFDVVTMWSVLAHLPTPIEDLTMLRGLLDPQGFLLILTVNANAIFLKNHGDGWDGFTQNHLKFFSPQTLPILLRRAGFKAVAFRPMYGDTIESGATHMSRRQVERFKAVVDRRGNQGQMMRAVAFNDPDAIPDELRGGAVLL